MIKGYINLVINFTLWWVTNQNRTTEVSKSSWKGKAI